MKKFLLAIVMVFCWVSLGLAFPPIDVHVTNPSLNVIVSPSPPIIYEYLFLRVSDWDLKCIWDLATYQAMGGQCRIIDQMQIYEFDALVQSKINEKVSEGWELVNHTFFQQDFEGRGWFLFTGIMRRPKP